MKGCLIKLWKIILYTLGGITALVLLAMILSLFAKPKATQSPAVTPAAAKQAVAVAPTNTAALPIKTPTAGPSPTSPPPTSTPQPTSTPLPTATPPPTNTPTQTSTALNTPLPTNTPAPTPEPWYAGGTLHKATVAEWSQATERNKLATAADWVTAGYKLTTVEEMTVYAPQIVACLDAFIADNAVVQPTSPIIDSATVCLIMLKPTK